MLLADKAELKNETGSVWELRYYVKEFDEVYGIKIERYATGEPASELAPKLAPKLASEVASGGAAEVAVVSKVVSEETRGIMPTYEAAKKLAQKLAAGAVTPMTLHDVVDDFVGKKI